MDGAIIDARRLLAENVKRVRKRLGLSQEKLAELICVSTQAITDIEHCRSWVSDKTLSKLAAALKSEVFELFAPNFDNTAAENLSLKMISLKNNLKSEICETLEANFHSIMSV